MVETLTSDNVLVKWNETFSPLLSVPFTFSPLLIGAMVETVCLSADLAQLRILSVPF
jgi:hypothetical protein